MDLFCILISPVGQMDRATLMANLGYAGAPFVGEETGMDGLLQEPTMFTLAQMGDCLLLTDFDMVEEAFRFGMPTDRMRVLISTFPEAEIGVFMLMSTNNTWGYSVISQGEILAREFGNADEGTTIEDGISLPEVEWLMEQSYTDDDDNRFFELETHPGRVFTHDQVGEEFVKSVSRRFLADGIFGNPALDATLFDVYDLCADGFSPSPVSPPPANLTRPVTSAPPVAPAPPLAPVPPAPAAAPVRPRKPWWKFW